MMYIDLKETERLRSYCQELRPYTYIERINYRVTKADNFEEDYLGVGVYPTLYSTTCTKEEAITRSGLYYSDIYIIRSPCREICTAYLHNQSYKDSKAVVKSPGIHTLFIVKEIANIVLDYTDLQFEVRNPKLVAIYKSRKGFGNRMSKVSKNQTDYRYRVSKDLA